MKVNSTDWLLFFAISGSLSSSLVPCPPPPRYIPSWLRMILSDQTHLHTATLTVHSRWGLGSCFSFSPLYPTWHPECGGRHIIGEKKKKGDGQMFVRGADCVLIHQLRLPPSPCQTVCNDPHDPPLLSCQRLAWLVPVLSSQGLFGWHFLTVLSDV